MPESHAYLVGAVGLGIVFSAFYFIRKDLRRLMVYSGLLYLIFMTAVFLLSKLMSSDPAKAINPGYWNPPSIFNLNAKTGGLGIEDVLYMFFVGGIAAVLYEIVFTIKVSRKINKKLKKGHALVVGLLVGSLVYVLTPINIIYFFIVLQFVGALALVWQRRDLIKHALVGGAFFMILYGALFLIFNFLFPHFLSDYYNLKRTSHVWIIGIPLEEFLYSLTLGLMWAPLYEYEHRVKDSKRRSSGLRRFSLAAANARR